MRVLFVVDGLAVWLLPLIQGFNTPKTIETLNFERPKSEGFEAKTSAATLTSISGFRFCVRVRLTCSGSEFRT